jgi:hypothetical protein
VSAIDPDAALLVAAALVAAALVAAALVATDELLPAAALLVVDGLPADELPAADGVLLPEPHAADAKRTAAVVSAKPLRRARPERLFFIASWSLSCSRHCWRSGSATGQGLEVG